MKHFAWRYLLVAVVLTALPQPGQSSAREPEQPTRLEPQTTAALIREINKLLIDQYIFLDVARKMKRHLESKLKAGAYDGMADAHRLAAQVRQDLYDVSKDNHFHLEFNPERARLIQAEQSPSPQEAARAREVLFERGRRRNFGFNKLEFLSGGVGYLDLDRFADPRFAGEVAVASMGWLAHADAIIIDLRDNPGGWPEMVQLLCSYIVKGTKDGRTHLNTFERRYTKAREQYWTFSWVPGKTLYDTNLYVLVSDATGSGAEEFSYHMKNLRRATIVGETTHGAAHPVDAKVLLERFVLHLPTGRPVNPVTGTNWEGTGVEPDVKVPSARAFDTAYKMALEKIAERVRDKDHAFELRWALDGLRGKLDPLQVPDATLARYAGAYGERKVSLENGTLFYQRTRPRRRLIPLKPELFALEGLDGFRIRFVLPKQGPATELIGVYDDATEDPSPRSP